MNGLPYYKAYPRDFIDGTAGMPFELKGAYRLLLDIIYLQAGRLPDDARYVSGLLGCSVRAWKKYRDELIERGKIIAENGIIYNFRADKELEISRSFQEKQRENGSKPKKNNTIEEAVAEPKSNHTDTDTEERETNVSPKKKVGTRLREDWRLPKALGDWAVSEGMPEAAVRTESDRFRDYWIAKAGKEGVKLDWAATWRNWARKWIADEAKARVRRGGSPSADRQLSQWEYIAKHGTSEGWAA